MTIPLLSFVDARLHGDILLLIILLTGVALWGIGTFIERITLRLTRGRELASITRQFEPDEEIVVSLDRDQMMRVTLTSTRVLRTVHPSSLLAWFGRAAATRSAGVPLTPRRTELAINQIAQTHLAYDGSRHYTLTLTPTVATGASSEPFRVEFERRATALRWLDEIEHLRPHDTDVVANAPHLPPETPFDGVARGILNTGRAVIVIGSLVTALVLALNFNSF